MVFEKPKFSNGKRVNRRNTLWNDESDNIVNNGSIFFFHDENR